MRRQISNLAFRSALQADRQQFPAGFLGARQLIEGLTKFGNRPLFANGKYDLSAIMTFARKAADAHQRRYGCDRAEAMSVALKAAWQHARTVRARSAH